MDLVEWSARPSAVFTWQNLRAVRLKMRWGGECALDEGFGKAPPYQLCAAGRQGVDEEDAITDCPIPSMR